MMSAIDTIRADFKDEMPSTRKVIERVPSDKGEWRPHAKSFPLGHLAQLISGMPGWMTNIASQPTLDFLKTPGYSYESTSTLLSFFDKNVHEATDALGAMSDAQLDDSWSLVRAEQVILTAKKGDMLRQTLRHLVHHRAQMTVYLRLLDIPVPSTYGPSADDKGAFSL
jgi:uncharacterized damage-inducible protein DinB